MSSGSLRHVALLAAIVWSPTLTGCKEDRRFPQGPQSFFPVKGTVLRGDTPLSGGTIKFTSDNPDFVASSPIGSDGSFSLESHFNQPARTIPGIPGGVYKATITMPPDGKSPRRIFSALDTYTVKYGGQDDLIVKLP